MSRASTVLLVLPLLALSLAGVAAGESTQRYIVGYEPSKEDASLLAVKGTGATVRRSDSTVGFAVVETSNPQALYALKTAGTLRYVETDDATTISGGQWNGAQWNGAQWNGAQWNGAQWNGAQWNGAQWNDADLRSVSPDQRLAAKWTEKHFQAETQKMRSLSESTDPGIVWQWGVWASDENRAWPITTGARQKSVCILDSGIAWDHPDLANNVAGQGYNAITPGASAYDDAGHGTHIAGLVGAQVGNGFGVAGGANTRLLAVKVLNAEGTGYESDLAFGLLWCAAQGANLGVMALSADQGPTLDAVLSYTASKGTLLMASAGNGFGAPVAYPASHPDVLAVSAVDGDLALASFSNRGPQVDIAAPGVAMLSTFPGNAFVFGSGTSQAVGFAAGIAALTWEANPSLTASQVAARLKATAVDLGPVGKDDSFGAGLVDADGALRG